MRDSALELAPAKAGKRVSWAREIREDLPSAFGFTMPVQRELPVLVAAVKHAHQGAEHRNGVSLREEVSRVSFPRDPA